MSRTTTALAATVAILLSSAVGAQGIVDSRVTNVTFSGPVTIPGATLGAGTYRFQLADSLANRNIVQIFDKNNKLMATMLAIPASRDRQEGDPVITFKETRSDVPPAVHFWYYAGERGGSEFVYPRSQAIQIARASGEPVMATDANSTEREALRNSSVSRVTPENANNQPAAQPAPPPAPRQSTPEASTAPAPAPQTTTAESQTAGTSGRSTRRRLPHTASSLPEVGLIGLVALCAGIGLAGVRRSLI